MKTRVVLLAGFIAVAAFAACNSGGSNNTPAAPCTIPATNFAVVYPAPNSATVPSGILQQVIVAVNSPLPGTWNAVIQYPANGVTQTAFGNTFVTVSPPFPTPNATPSFANPVYQSSSFPGNPVIPPQTQVSVFLNNLNSGCTPTSVSSFTTQ